MHYVHKGGEDSSLPNHRPLTLVDVLREVFSSVPTSRMRRDWTRLRILDTCNPGFEPGRMLRKFAIEEESWMEGGAVQLCALALCTLYFIKFTHERDARRDGQH